MTTRSECAQSASLSDVSAMRFTNGISRSGKHNVDRHIADLDAFFHRSAANANSRVYQAVYYPLGFPLRVHSNSPVILAAAEQSWHCFGPVFLHAPLEITIAVKMLAAGPRELPPAPDFQLRDSLLVNSSDHDNFVLVNLINGRAAGLVTETTAESSLFLRYHFLEAAALSMIATLHAVALHAACVRYGNTGLLLCGDSGAGKSSLAFACARAGWTYVCDDAAYMPLDRDDRLVVGNCHQVRFRPSAMELFPEIEGRPLTPRAAGKPSIEARMSEWPNLSTSGNAKIDYIVFLNRNAGTTQELVSKSGSEAHAWFRQHLLTVNTARDARETALSRLVEARVFELRYSGMSWAIDRLRQLSMEGR